MIDWFARNDVAANILLLLVIVCGIYSVTTQVKIEIFPEVEPDFINITVPLRGATPEDMELSVAIRIEEAVQDLEGIEEITSTSKEGTTTVSIEIDQDFDNRALLDDVKNRVDSISTFPVDAEKPVIALAQRKKEVITVVIAGDHSETEVRNYAERIRDDLLRQEGITQVELDAVRDYEINIEVSQDVLRNLGLTLSEVAEAIQKNSLDLSGGNIRSTAGDILIRSKGQAYRKDDFSDIVIKVNEDGTIIRLGDVANINDGFTETSLKSSFNGEFAALIQVYRIGDQSALDISKRVRAYIEKRQQGLPNGMRLSYWDDDSAYLKARLNTLISNALQGGLLVILLLALFLKPSIAFWVFLGIPVSFLGSMALMPVFDISINVISLFGFILVLGIVVDDAIVTGENIYARMRDGMKGVDAAIFGTQQVAVPVTFGILTTVAAFLPLAFLDGRMGNFMYPIPLVVIPCLLFSLLESKFVLPAHLKHVKVNSGKEETNAFSRFQQNFAQGFESLILKFYTPILAVCVKHRYAVLATFIGVFFIIMSLLMSGWIKFVFQPRIESDSASVNLIMPVGTPFSVTDTYMQRIVHSAMELQEEYKDGDTDNSIITNILATTGSAGRLGTADNYGRVRIETIPSDQRLSNIKMYELVAAWREKIGTIPGAESLTFKAEIFSTGEPIAVRLQAHSLEVMEQVSDKLKQQLTTYPTVFDIEDSLEDGKEELKVELNEQGHVLGLTRSDIINQIGQAFRGFEAQRIQRGRDDVRVIIRLPLQERSNLATLDEYLITTPNGKRVPLSHVASLRPDTGLSTIKRIDRYRVLTVTADVDKDKANMALIYADIKRFMDELLVQYPEVSYSLEGEAKEQKKSLGSMKIGLIVLLFIIFCLLAIPLKSFLLPFVVMSVIPFGIIGAVLGHWVMGKDPSLMSLMGLMALIGVVVNDSLVLVDYINQELAKGMKLSEAIVKSGSARFRPVMLTSLTTFIGLMPLLFEKSVQAQFLIPMATSLGFGIIFATLITLVMVPANVMIANDIKRMCRYLIQ